MLLQNKFNYLVPGTDNILLRHMKSRAVSYKRTQDGFTMVEVIAALVIMAVVAAYAIPRMMGSNDFAAKVTADRILAALHYAQTLAQRQGVATDVVITTLPSPSLAVKQGGTAVNFPTQNYDGTPTPIVAGSSSYDVILHPEVVINPGATISYGTNGNLTAGANTYIIAHGNLDKFNIKVEPTGFAHIE